MDITVEEYAKRFKMSKEMVASKIRQNKLNYTLKDGEPLISIPEEKESNPLKKHAQTNSLQKNVMQKATVATVLGLYKRENNYLKEKIEQLEMKIDKLINDKEDMLKSERDRIEQIYSNKDEQLKNILELVNEKMLQEQQNQTIHEIEHSQVQAPKIIELKKYLKTLELDSIQRKNIKKRFEESLKDDIRIIEQNGKIYLDFSKYDYSDLLAL